MRRNRIAAIAVAAMLTLVARAHAVVQGIDISHYQGNINWTSVKNAGIQFAFAKATDGVGTPDAKFIQNMDNAIAAGVYIGPYHFARPESGETNAQDPVNEANEFVNRFESYYQSAPTFMMRPVLDLETIPDDPVSPSVKAFVSNWTRSFIDRVHTRLGFYPLIYTGGYYSQNYLEQDLSQYDLWFAKPITPTPNDPNDSAYQNNINNISPPTDAQMGIWSSYKFWQWSWEGAISGISGNVDRDVFNGTIDQLKEQFVPGLATPPPIAGDYNGDGTVNVADYSVWRFYRGQRVTSGMNGDGDGNTRVDNADYQVWMSNFGKSNFGAGAGASPSAYTGVPEPSTLSLLSVAWLFVATCRRR